MTIKEFAKKHNTGVRTVRGWIVKGYLPGAIIEKDFIPESARKPYSETRARKNDSIVKGILTACNRREGIFPSLFKLSSAEFDVFINELIQEDLIRPFTDERKTYYHLTSKGLQNLKNNRKADWVQIALVIGEALPTVIKVFEAI